VSTSARETILAAIRTALADAPTGTRHDTTPGAADGVGGEDRVGTVDGVADEPPIAREYLTAHVSTGLVDLLAENLADYRAHVHRTSPAELPDVIARLLAEHGSTGVAVPTDLPEEWLTTARAADVAVTADTPPLSPEVLDRTDSVITGCALAIAETGTIVLDAGPGQGRRVLTLIPDHHICVIHCPEQVVASVPEALPKLDPVRPQTWIAGPSATSDIELDRVEGVHGPRRLDAVLVVSESD
jgi:L-lactate dehydrogenase complex protein LldG